MSVRRRAGGLLVALSLVGLGGCGGSGGGNGDGGGGGGGAKDSASTTRTASPTTPSGRLMVVLGDSIPYGGHFCPGCTAFADTYAKTIQQTTGQPVTVRNHSRDDSATLADIEVQLRDDAAVKAELAQAAVVLISVGFNNTPAWPAGNPCGGRVIDDIDAQVATIVRYPTSCIRAGVQVYRPAYDRIYAAIAATAPASATLITVDVYNNWIGNPGIRSDTSAATLTRLATTTKRIYDDWNAMLCASARQHGFACADIYHAFNGPHGLTPPDEKVQAQDYTHPSQAGNDVIAAVLARVPLKS